MGFILLLLLSSLSIAGSAAFFSVYGLARIFSGAFIPVILMASSLEAGKLVAASFLYQFWNKITTVMKSLMTLVVIGLMIITSLGIFGFLSNANNTTLIPFEQQQSQITTLQAHVIDVQQLKTERLTRSQEINKQIANLPDNYVNGRKRLMSANQNELQQVSKDVSDYTKDILDTQNKIASLKSQSVQTASDVGPIVYIAKAFNIDITTATKYLIFLIMFVFDPLAVMLTIAANIAIVDRKKQPIVNVKTSILEPARELPSIPSIEEAKTIPVSPVKIYPIKHESGWTNDVHLTPNSSINPNLFFPNPSDYSGTAVVGPLNSTLTATTGGANLTGAIPSGQPFVFQSPWKSTNENEVQESPPKPISELTDDEIRAELEALPEPKTKEEIEYKSALDRILHRTK